ncbi:hypothetical protein C0992_010349 [Termitomyces sp. T32_za158]|nr:hypothetical protein C0992_010349 [Termitomyces sp. T32_za158]
MQSKSLVILASGLAIANAGMVLPGDALLDTAVKLPLKLVDTLSDNAPIVNPDGPQCTAPELEKIDTLQGQSRSLATASVKQVGAAQKQDEQVLD